MVVVKQEPVVVRGQGNADNADASVSNTKGSVS